MIFSFNMKKYILLILFAITGSGILFGQNVEESYFAIDSLATKPRPAAAPATAAVIAGQLLIITGVRITTVLI